MTRDPPFQHRPLTPVTPAANRTALIPGRARDRVFLGGQAISMIGDGLALLAIPLLVLRLTSSPVAAVLAALPGSAGYLAAGLPAGVLADRVSPWLVLAGGNLIQALIFLLLFALTAAGAAATPAWLILALAFAAGVVTVFADTGLLGDDPRPVFAAAGTVTLATVATAWFVALRHEDAGPLALTPRGR